MNGAGAGTIGAMSDTVAAPPVPAPRGRPRSEAVDRAIAEATIAILQEDGYEGLTMAGVAQRAGVSTATLYRRFTGKVDLVVGALTALKPDAHAIDTGSLEGDLRAMVVETCGALQTSIGQLMRSLVGEMQRNEELAAAVRERLVASRVEAAQQMLGAAVARGEIEPPADPTVVLDMFSGPFIIRHLLGTATYTDYVGEEIVKFTMRMLGASPTTPSTARTARHRPSPRRVAGR